MLKNNIECKVIEPHISDHSGVWAVFHDILNSNVNKQTNLKLVRDLTPKAIRLFRDVLSEVDWTYLRTYNNSIDFIFNEFINFLTTSFEECCVLKRIKIDL
ncbi:hypothetical protein J6590_108182 [Homalodisca vitripennis]|nr:hypothetical protein J6590_108649 [Homalodisca vitripennis]KAG8308690.1 hypothetical protein J6590_108182 [Homalodisca vitripennis]